MVLGSHWATAPSQPLGHKSTGQIHLKPSVPRQPFWFHIQCACIHAKLCQSCPTLTQNGAQFKVCALFTSGIFRLIISDCSWPGVTETEKSKTTDKEQTAIIQEWQLLLLRYHLPCLNTMTNSGCCKSAWLFSTFILSFRETKEAVS